MRAPAQCIDDGDHLIVSDGTLLSLQHASQRSVLSCAPDASARMPVLDCKSLTTPRLDNPTKAPHLGQFLGLLVPHLGDFIRLPQRRPLLVAVRGPQRQPAGACGVSMVGKTATSSHNPSQYSLLKLSPFALVSSGCTSLPSVATAPVRWWMLARCGTRGDEQ